MNEIRRKAKGRAGVIGRKGTKQANVRDRQEGQIKAMERNKGEGNEKNWKKGSGQWKMGIIRRKEWTGDRKRGRKIWNRMNSKKRVIEN